MVATASSTIWAAQDVAKAFPADQVDASTYIENVKEEDSERPIRELAQKGCGMIFATSFGFGPAVAAVAKDFPNVKFEHATGFQPSDNVATYNLRWYQGRYVMARSRPRCRRRASPATSRRSRFPK